jgi:CubicO group peptidase (beta-lactamase class C family)
MSSNHLANKLIPYNKTAKGRSCGFAVSVIVNPEMSGFMSSTGNYVWGGVASTYFRIDPQEKIIMISMA